MAFGNGPRIVTDGLVLSLDASDRNSYVSGSTTWYDLSGNNNTGTLINGPTFNSTNGGSLVFNGTNQSVNSSDSTSLNVGNTISVFGWFFINSVSIFQPIIAKGVSPNGWELDNSSGTLRCTLRPSITGSNEVIAGTLLLNTWNNGGFTCDNTTIRLYLNGVQVGSKSATSLTLNTTGPLYVGQRNDTVNINYFNGNIANAQIYNRALSAAEVLQNYNASKSRFNLK